MARRQKTTLNDLASILTKRDKELHDLTETVGFVVKNMATKDEVRQIVREELKPIEDGLAAVESKIAGTNRRLDNDAMMRDDLSIPKRVSDLEQKTFGASRHPKHIPLK